MPLLISKIVILSLIVALERVFSHINLSSKDDSKITKLEDDNTQHQKDGLKLILSPFFNLVSITFVCLIFLKVIYFNQSYIYILFIFYTEISIICAQIIYLRGIYSLDIYFVWESKSSKNKKFGSTYL